MKPIRNFEGSIGVHAWGTRLGYTQSRGEGGEPGQFFFLRFVTTCCSPGYPRAKMGSLVSQLQTVAEIWRVKEGSLSRVFGN